MTPSLRIKQQNCRKSKTAVLSLLNTIDPAQWDIVLLQEPYIYPDSTLTVASHAWIMIYPSPTTEDPTSPSSVVLINSNLGSRCFQQVPLAANLVTAITYRSDESPMPITIFNVYNLPNADHTLTFLDEWLSALPDPPSQVILARDFNKHHLLWAGTEHPQRCRGNNTDSLTHIISQFDFSLASPCGVPTYQSDAHGTWSTLDLVFCTADIED